MIVWIDRADRAEWNAWFAQIRRDRSLVEMSAYHDRIFGDELTWRVYRLCDSMI